jgi:hypothetical protein
MIQLGDTVRINGHHVYFVAVIEVSHFTGIVMHNTPVLVENIPFTSIEQLDIVQRAPVKGFLAQNNVREGDQWTLTMRDGGKPWVGQVESIRHDMVVFRSPAHRGRLYFDFAYRGLHQQLPFSAIECNRSYSDPDAECSLLGSSGAGDDTVAFPDAPPPEEVFVPPPALSSADSVYPAYPPLHWLQPILPTSYASSPPPLHDILLENAPATTTNASMIPCFQHHTLSQYRVTSTVAPAPLSTAPTHPWIKFPLSVYALDTFCLPGHRDLLDQVQSLHNSMVFVMASQPCSPAGFIHRSTATNHDPGFPLQQSTMYTLITDRSQLVPTVPQLVSPWQRSCPHELSLASFAHTWMHGPIAAATARALTQHSRALIGETMDLIQCVVQTRQDQLRKSLDTLHHTQQCIQQQQKSIHQLRKEREAAAATSCEDLASPFAFPPALLASVPWLSPADKTKLATLYQCVPSMSVMECIHAMLSLDQAMYFITMQRIYVMERKPPLLCPKSMALSLYQQADTERLMKQREPVLAKHFATEIQYQRANRSAPKETPCFDPILDPWFPSYGVIQKEFHVYQKTHPLVSLLAFLQQTRHLAKDAAEEMADAMSLPKKGKRKVRVGDKALIQQTQQTVAWNGLQWIPFIPPPAADAATTPVVPPPPISLECLQQRATQLIENTRAQSLVDAIQGEATVLRLRAAKNNRSTIPTPPSVASTSVPALRSAYADDLAAIMAIPSDIDRFQTLYAFCQIHLQSHGWYAQDEWYYDSATNTRIVPQSLHTLAILYTSAIGIAPEDFGTRRTEWTALHGIQEDRFPSVWFDKRAGWMVFTQSPPPAPPLPLSALPVLPAPVDVPAPAPYTEWQSPAHALFTSQLRQWMNLVKQWNARAFVQAWTFIVLTAEDCTVLHDSLLIPASRGCIALRWTDSNPSLAAISIFVACFSAFMVTKQRTLPTPASLPSLDYWCTAASTRTVVSETQLKKSVDYFVAQDPCIAQWLTHPPVAAAAAPVVVPAPSSSSTTHSLALAPLTLPAPTLSTTPILPPTTDDSTAAATVLHDQHQSFLLQSIAQLQSILEQTSPTSPLPLPTEYEAFSLHALESLYHSLLSSVNAQHQLKHVVTDLKDHHATVSSPFVSWNQFRLDPEQQTLVAKILPETWCRAFFLGTATLESLQDAIASLRHTIQQNRFLRKQYKQSPVPEEILPFSPDEPFVSLMALFRTHPSSSFQKKQVRACISLFTLVPVLTAPPPSEKTFPFLHPTQLSSFRIMAHLSYFLSENPNVDNK